MGLFDEDNNLVKFEHIEKFKQLPVLLRILQLDIVLPQSVQGQLGLIVDVNFHGILHELFADGPDIFAEGGAQHLVTLVQNKMFQVLERQLLTPDESQNPARSSNHNPM